MSKLSASAESTKSGLPPPGCIMKDLSFLFLNRSSSYLKNFVVMEPDFLILMLAGNGRALKYVFRDCDHVFRPICFKFGGYMGMV